MLNELKVLFVDDSDSDVLLLVKYLAKTIKVNWKRVENEKDFLKSLNKEIWDIVLADYVMPEFSGLAVLEIIKTQNPDVPVIIISGKIGEDIAVESIKLGAWDYILKDNLSRLEPAIERAVKEAQIQKEHKQYHNYLNRMLNGMVESVMVVDPELTIVDVNQSFTNQFYESRKDIIGKKCHQITHKQDDPCSSLPYSCPAQKVLKTRKSVKEKHVHIDCYGNPVNVEINVFPLFDEKENIEYIVEISHDITDRVNSEKALKESEEKFRSLAENSQDYILKFDLDKRIMYMNPAALKVSKMEQLNVVGKTLQEAGYNSEMYAFWNTQIENIVENKESYHTQDRWKTAGKTFFR